MYKRYIAAPVQSTDTMAKIFLELAETSMRELSPLQKETLLKAFEWGMNTNHAVLSYSLEESLKYHLAEYIAHYSFSEYVRVSASNGWDERAKELSQYRDIDGEISARYHSTRGRSGLLYNPATLKPRDW